jgi:hypothetical protein
MGKINQYLSVAAPKLDDKLVGTSVGGNPVDSTYNFTLAKLLELFSNNFTANSFILSDVDEYEDNETAITAGLEVGQFYRTGDLLKIVH